MLIEGIDESIYDAPQGRKPTRSFSRRASCHRLAPRVPVSKVLLNSLLRPATFANNTVWDAVLATTALFRLVAWAQTPSASHRDVRANYSRLQSTHFIFMLRGSIQQQVGTFRSCSLSAQVDLMSCIIDVFNFRVIFVRGALHLAQSRMHVRACRKSEQNATHMT